MSQNRHTILEEFLIEENKKLKKEILSLKKKLNESIDDYNDMRDRVYSTSQRSLDSRLDCMTGRLAAA